MIDLLAKAPAGPHPTPDELYRAQQEPGSEWSAAILAHAAACAACSEEMLRQEAFDTPEPLEETAIEAAWLRFRQEPSATPSAPEAPKVVPFRRPGRRPWRQALLLAATLAACAIGIAVWRTTLTPTAHLATSPLPEETTRGGVEAATDWAPTGTLSAPPTEFVFSAEGEPYRVAVYDGERSFGWTSEPTTTGRVAFPPEQRALLKPGVVYYWSVLGDEGTPPDETARTFQIKAQQP